MPQDPAPQEGQDDPGGEIHSPPPAFGEVPAVYVENIRPWESLLYELPDHDKSESHEMPDQDIHRVLPHKTQRSSEDLPEGALPVSQPPGQSDHGEASKESTENEERNVAVFIGSHGNRSKLSEDPAGSIQKEGEGKSFVTLQLSFMQPQKTPERIEKCEDHGTALVVGQGIAESIYRPAAEKCQNDDLPVLEFRHDHVHQLVDDGDQEQSTQIPGGAEILVLLVDAEEHRPENIETPLCHILPHALIDGIGDADHDHDKVPSCERNIDRCKFFPQPGSEGLIRIIDKAGEHHEHRKMKQIDIFHPRPHGMPVYDQQDTDAFGDIHPVHSSPF